MAEMDPLFEKEEEKERKGGGFFFWLSNSLASRFMLSSAFIAVLIISVMGLKDVLQRRGAFSSRGVSREQRPASPQPKPADAAQAQASRGVQGFDGVSGHAGVGAQAPERTSAQLGAGADDPAIQALLSKALKQAKDQRNTQYYGTQDPPGAKSAKPEDSRSTASSKGQDGGTRADGGGMAGRAVTMGGQAGAPNIIKGLTRSWENRAKPKNSSLKFGEMSMLDRLKGMENTLRGVSGRKEESATAWNKKEWDASAHAETAMSARGNDGYNANIREEVAGRSTKAGRPKDAPPKDLPPANDGGPIAQAEPAPGSQGQSQASAAPADGPGNQTASRGAQYLLDAAAALLPVASLMLLGSAQGMEEYDVLAKRSAKGAIQGTGVVTDGQPGPGARQ